MTEAEKITDRDGGAEPPARYQCHGNIAVITLNRPHTMNAVNSDLSIAVGAALERASRDTQVRAVVITGAGRSFCAGVDLKAVAAGHRVDVPDHPDWGFAGMVRHWIDKPTIAAVNGYALGGGTEIVLACDLAVIEEHATLGLPEAKRGLFPAGGGVIRMPRQVPLKIALEMAFTGEPITATRAYELGLVNRIAAAGEALPTALELANSIASNAPLSLQHSKEIAYHSVAGGPDWALPEDGGDLWALNEHNCAAILASEDAHEGTAAFADKRHPQWIGR